ncbi:MAG: histidine kinase [Bacteroidota bacterium]
MKNRLFVHHPLFRIFAPLFSGALVYLLIILINNSIEELANTFFGQELYVCIGLSYLIQEFARYSLVFFQKRKRPKSFVLKTVWHALTVLVTTIVLVSGAMYLYFVGLLSYTPNASELIMFNAIFGVIAFLYVLLYVGHQFLYKVNKAILKQEEILKQETEENFQKFAKDINPALLFESLEAILVLMKKEAQKAENLTEEFASIYRYLLSSRKKEVIQIKEELAALNGFAKVLEALPFRKTQLHMQTPFLEGWLVPGSLLFVYESIVRTTIPSEYQSMQIEITDHPSHIMLQYEHEERLDQSLNLEIFDRLRQDISFYTDQPIEIVHDTDAKTIKLPKIQLA